MLNFSMIILLQICFNFISLHNFCFISAGITMCQRYITFPTCVGIITKWMSVLCFCLRKKWRTQKNAQSKFMTPGFISIILIRIRVYTCMFYQFYIYTYEYICICIYVHSYVRIYIYIYGYFRAEQVIFDFLQNYFFG